MIPTVSGKNSSPLVQDFAQALAGEGFEGDIHTDWATRVAVSTDNSIYQLVPEMVLYPRHRDDVCTIFTTGNREQFQTIAFSPRGGGTGTNGQSLNTGVVIDTTRYMYHIQAVDCAGEWAEVQPAVVLDQLNDYLKDDQLFFAPSLSTSNRATLGGMTNTDACGKGSILYGRTSEHILEIECVCVDGTVLRCRPLAPQELQQQLNRHDKAGELYRTTYDVISHYHDEIERTFPRLSRFMTGYNLARVMDEQGNFNLNYLLAGSEGTLALVTGLKLKLTKLPACKCLFAIQYPHFDGALRSGWQLLEHQPAAVETIDDRIVDLAREDEIYHQVGPMLVAPQGAPIRAVNLVEIIADDPRELENRQQALAETLTTLRDNGDILGFYVTRQAQEIAALWELRKKGVGLLGNMDGSEKPVPFMEDTAVPPQVLADYIAEVRALLDHYQLTYGMFGHVDVGCLHVRPALDMTQAAQRDLVPRITSQINALVQKYGGVYWSEHGKGFRSAYVKDYFGPVLYEQLRVIKAAFDPHNRLNPGKIVTPAGSADKVVDIAGPYKGVNNAEVPEHVRKLFSGAFDCNGNAACLNYDYDNTICPSAKVSRNWVNSPKGRSELLRNWLYGLAAQGYDQLQHLPRTKLPGNKRSGEDFAHQVYASMQKCLGCKACASSCPLKVDIPTMRARFLSQYHSRYRRPVKDYIVAAVEKLAWAQAYWPRLFNRVNQAQLMRTLLARVAGLQDLPRLSPGSLYKTLRHKGVRRFREAEIARLDANERQKCVCLVQDALTSAYHAEVVLAGCDMLQALGYTVYVLPFRENGKGLHTKGFLKRFRRVAARNTRFYNRVAAYGIPLLGIEPSMVLCYRDEYVSTLGSSVQFRVELINEWLVRVLENQPVEAQPAQHQVYYFYPHCSEKALALASAEQWQQIFARMGLILHIGQAGCCGMAGTFGHECQHYEDSRKLYQMSWQQKIEGQDAGKVLASGFSCRSQVKRFGGRHIAHPLEVLAGHIASRVA